MTRDRTIELRQWPYGNQLINTVHHIGDDGEESVEITGVHEKLKLAVEDRGHELVLPERARAARK